MKIALITLSDEGARLLNRLRDGLGNADVFLHATVSESFAGRRFESVITLTREIFGRYGGLVYVAPCGVAVRALAENIRDKHTDPGVVVVDVGGRFAVSLMGGHEGGANLLAIRVGNIIGAEPVISTTTEALKIVIVGIGCRRGVKAETIVDAVTTALGEAGIERGEVRLLASADIKMGETGLIEAADILGMPLRFIGSEEIRSSGRTFARSDFVKEKVNLPAVAEPAALLAGRRTRLILPKRIIGDVTVALARGKLFVVGIGPGGPPDRTKRAEEAIARCSVIIGYTRYLGLIRDLTAGKELVATGMTKEVERCRAALRHAAEGKEVALISSGDPGVYGMAGLALELAHDEKIAVPIEIVPGLTSANAAAARLGAPLMCDYATVSLSDLLVPWDVIRKKIEAAAGADFVVAIYNPRSSKRTKQLREAAEIFRKYRPGHTPVGIGTAVGTADEKMVLSDLDHFLEEEIDMRSIVLVGNLSSRYLDGWLITPRGYKI